ncbi:MAG: hypothetical protein HYY61_01980 [Deltaproteobacteria bacterium]|nr:hypothetical protein [Deltaproteobacteria bacterium]
MLSSWDMGIFFIGYALFVLLLIASYIYFLFSKTGKPKTEDLPPILLMHPSVQEWWAWATHPLENHLIKKNIHPNTMSGLAFLMATISFIGFSFGWFVLAGLCMLLESVLEIFARRALKKSGLAQPRRLFICSHLEFLSESLVFLGILDYYTNTLFFYVIFTAFLSSILIHFSKVQEEVLGADGKISFIHRFERMMWIGISSILSPLISAIANNFFPMSNTWFASVAITIVALLGAHSCYRWFDSISKKLK